MERNDGIIILQPNGLFARWTHIVKDFTHTNMTQEQASQVCVEYMEMTMQQANVMLHDLTQKPTGRCLDFHSFIQELVEKHKGRVEVAESRKELMTQPAAHCQMELH